MVIESAFDRILRNLFLAIGIGSVVFTLLGAPAVFEQSPYLVPWYAVGSVVLFSGLPPLAAMLAFRAPLRVLRAIGIIHVALAPALLVVWLPSMTSARLPDDQIPWLINTVSVATCVAAVILPTIAAWLYLLAVAIVCGVLRFALYGGGDASLAVQDAIMIVLLSGVMMALLQLALQAGRKQDEAARQAQEAAAATAAAESLETQRARYHAFMHDDVLATLNSAARNVAGAAAVTRASAERALLKMNSFRERGAVAVALGPGELDMLFGTAARSVGVELESVGTGSRPAGPSVPRDVADALAEALVEALRNSIRHAGWPDGRTVNRGARLTMSPRGVVIVVTDDGKGFVAHRIALDRLGIRVSILQRVNSQPGGRASVRSARGAGTTITLEWEASDEE